MSKKSIRASFRRSVFERDKYTCQICGEVYLPDQADPALGVINAHHITDRKMMQNGGYVKDNGITVCDEHGNFRGSLSCHMVVEQWHISGGDRSRVAEEYRPKSLYIKIGSSYELALRKSKLLK